MPRHVEVSVKVAPGEAECARMAADYITTVITDAVAKRGLARIALSGGNTPKCVFELLASPDEPFRSQIPWPQVQLFWVDERCVPPDNPESNFGMTRRALLDHVPVANVFRMEGELDPELGASRYEAIIRTAFRLEGAETPTFDLVLLGLGDDGHTASLFPHTAAIDELARICIANHVPQKDTWRLTLTWPVITQGREVAFLIEGATKAEMIRTVFTGPYDPESLPSQLIRPASGRLTLLLDTPAASCLPLRNLADGSATLELA